MRKRMVAFALAMFMLFGCLSPFGASAEDGEGGNQGVLNDPAPNPTDDMELIASFDFENDPVNNVLASAGGLDARAETFGTPAWTAADGALDGTRAVTMSGALDNRFWMHLQKRDGSPLLAGLKEFAISYDINPAEAAGGNSSWLFWVGRSKSPPKPNYERYIAVREFAESTAIRRWYKAGNPRLVNAPPDFGPTEQTVAANSGWKHVDIVFSENGTYVYVNGVLESTRIGEESVAYIISSAGGYALVGKNQYGAGHLSGSSGQSAARPDQFFNGQLDNFKVWKPTALDDAGKVAAAKEALILPYGIAENQVYGNITLPDEGLFDTAITWETSHPAIVDLNKYEIENYEDRLPGLVTRPANADTVVTMTATIRSESITDTKTFSFTVKKAPETRPETDAYLFVHFTGTENVPTDEQIYFALSDDMETFTDMTPRGTPVLTSSIGDYGVRDPYIIRSPEGDKFYLIATDLNVHLRGGWGSQPDGTGVSFSSTCLVVWESTDLLNWSEPRLVDVAGNVSGAWMAWAPEAVYDEATGDYFVFWATGTPVKPETAVDRTSGFGNTSAFPRPAYVHIYYARTRDFITFTPAQFWIDAYGDNTKAASQTGDGSIIDTTVILSNDGFWYRASKECWGAYNRGNRTSIDKSMEFVTLNGNKYPALTGKWDRTNPSDGSNDTQLGRTETRASLQSIFYPTEDIFSTYRALEGPELFRYNEENWKDGQPTYGLMADAYGGGTGYIPFYTNDLDSLDSVAQGGAWDLSSVDLGPLRKRHGSILNITQAEYDAIMAKYKTPTAVAYPEEFGEELTAGMKLIADFDFEDVPNAGDATPFIDKTGNAKAYSRRADRTAVAKSLSADTPEGTGSSWEFPNTTTANNRRWLDLYKNNGAEPDTALMLDADGEVYGAIVVSFDNKRTNANISSGGPNYAFYLDRDTTAKAETALANLNYIGTSSSRKTLVIDRFLGGRQRGPSGATNNVGQWNHFDIVIKPYSTALYINGKLADARGTIDQARTLADILGPTGGFMQLGRGNWGANGEYHIGLIDNFKIYAAPYSLSAHTITTTVGTGGTVTGGGTYDKGAIVTLTAAHSNNYAFDGWYEDGVKIPGADATYTFTATADRTLEARFVQITSAIDIELLVTSKILEKCAANLPLKITPVGFVPDSPIVITLTRNGNVYGTATADKDGIALVNATAFPEAGTYMFVATCGDITGTLDLEVVPYNLSIWDAVASLASDGESTMITFGETPVPKSGTFDGCVIINAGTPLTGISVDGNAVIIPYEYAKLEKGDKITVVGVKYPNLFPSYNFTFTIEIK